MLVVFTALAVWAGSWHVLPGDVRFTQWVQGLDVPLLDTLTNATNTSMGGVPLTVSGIAIVMVLFIWSRVDAAVLGIALAVRLINGGLKHLVESPRPDDHLVAVTSEVHGFGYPSGHASGALLIVGALAWVMARHIENAAARWLVWIVAGSWILMTGIGRIRVGAHWPTDVLSAWLWAIPALVLITRVALRFEASRRRDGQALPNRT
jgi:undecaprenyl-diphosphatase